MQITGSIVAIVTPFSGGIPDIASLQGLVKWHIDQGTDGIVIVGSTGESALLSEQERLEAIIATVTVARAAERKIKIIAGCGDSSTSETVKMVKDAEACGVDAIMVVAPCYVKPNQEGLKKHFEIICTSTSLPVILYNNPGRTGVDIKTETFEELCQNIKNIIAIKESSADLEKISMLKLKLPERVSLLSGDDSTNIGFMAHGGRGIISVTANVAPKLCKEFIDKWARGDCGGALETHQILMPIHKAMFCQPSPCPVKYALYKLGKINNEVRLPFIPIDEKSESAVIIENVIKVL